MAFARIGCPDWLIVMTVGWPTTWICPIPKCPDWLPLGRAWRLEMGWSVTFPRPMGCINGWTLMALFMTWGWSWRPCWASTDPSISAVALGGVDVLLGADPGKIAAAPPTPTPMPTPTAAPPAPGRLASGSVWTTCVRPGIPKEPRSSSASASWRLCSVMLASAKLCCRMSHGSWFVPMPLLPPSPPGDPPKMSSSSRKSRSTLTLGRPVGSLADSWTAGWTSGTWPLEGNKWNKVMDEFWWLDVLVRGVTQKCRHENPRKPLVTLRQIKAYRV